MVHQAKGSEGAAPAARSGELAHLAEASTATITEHEREIYRMQSDAPPAPNAARSPSALGCS